LGLEEKKKNSAVPDQGDEGESQKKEKEEVIRGKGWVNQEDDGTN